MRNSKQITLMGLLSITALLVGWLAGVWNGMTASVGSLMVAHAAGTQLELCKRGQSMGTATLIVNILTGQIFDAFRSAIPEISMISTDFGKTESGFAQPVKWGQEVISQISVPPTVVDHTPGDDLSTGAQDVTDLVTDVKVKINRAKKVRLKLPTADAVSLAADGVFIKAIREAATELGRAVVADLIKEANTQNFSQEIEQPVASADYDVLGAARIALNLKGAKTPRYVLGGSAFVGAIALDPRVQSGDYHGQKTEADPYVLLENIEGFSAVREFPNMPSNSTVIGAFTAATTDIVTLNAHGLANGDRVRVSNSGGALPAGLTANKDYYVRDADTNTFKLAGTPAGAAVDITGTGTGTHTLTRYEGLNAFAYEKRALHAAFRQLNDNKMLADQLGIPQTFLSKTEVDPDSGLAVTVYLWQHQTTHDIFATIVVAYGIKAGKALTGADVPATEAAGSGFDYAGLRIVEDALDNAA